MLSDSFSRPAEEHAASSQSEVDHNRDQQAEAADADEGNDRLRGQQEQKRAEMSKRDELKNNGTQARNVSQR